MTKQQIWSQKQKAAGRCVTCGGPRGDKVKCDKCAAAGGVTYRKNTPAQWAAVDWSLTDHQIAEMMGVTYTAIAYQRRKHG